MPTPVSRSKGPRVTVWEYELSRNDGVALRYLRHYDAVTDAAGEDTDSPVRPIMPRLFPTAEP